MPTSRSLWRRPPLSGESLASYRRERVRELSFPAGVALVEGGFVGVVASQLYGASPIAIAAITAAPMAGNLSSLLWARLAEGRAKIPFLTALQSVFVLAVVAMAALPGAGHASGEWALVGTMVVARLLLGGVVTLRSLVWTHNYPRETRARITARLSLLTISAMTVTSLLAGFALELGPDAFRLVYAGGALISLVGTVVFAKLKLLDREAVALLPETAARPARAEPLPTDRGAIALLRSDPNYARYLAWQFLLGVSNMISEAPVLWLVSYELKASPAIGVLILQGLPLAFSALSLPLWGPYLDRVHVARFRARHGWLWVAAQALVWIGALGHSLLAIAIGRAVFGVARGGGLLAWQIGHNDFTTPERANLYMGVHVTLTGMRGLLAPALGMLVYLGVAGIAWLPTLPGLGATLFLLSAIFSGVATWGFGNLERRLASGAAEPRSAQ